MPTEDSFRRIHTTCLLILTFIASGVALYLLRSMLIPFVLAGFFVILLSPVISWQMRHLKLPSSIALGTTLILGALILIVMGGLIASSVYDFSQSGEDYSARITQLEAKATDFLQSIGIDPGKSYHDLMEKLPALAKSTLAATVDGLISVSSQGVLVLIFMGFLLAGVVTGAPTGTRGRVEEGVKKYLGVKIAVSALTAILVYAVLEFCNVPLALLWALLTFLLNFIPNIGSIIASLLPLPVIILSPQVSAPLVAILLPLVIQFGIGNVVEPRLMGKSLGLHPVTVLMALIFWGMLWGFVGMLLSVPLTLTMRILLEQSEFTRPLASAMAGNLTEPVEADAR